jgi:endonuclease-3 related protein
MLEEYGQQGWWPLLSVEGFYHKSDYSFPRDLNERFEICIGAVLTQNTAWKSVIISLKNLKELKLIDPALFLKAKPDTVKTAIKPSGYFNQKYIYLKNFTNFFIKLSGNVPSRKELLSVKGIGPETADSILLYAYKEPEFVVDNYTRRVFSALEIIDEKSKYNEIKALFETSLKKEISESENLIRVYQEFHALIVEHAKRNYSRKQKNKLH